MVNEMLSIYMINFAGLDGCIWSRSARIWWQDLLPDI